MTYLLLLLPAFALALYAQFKVKSTFKKYSGVRSTRGFTGADVATALLRKNGLISKVGIEPVPGELTDHYDPQAYKVRLSESVYNTSTIAAMGVAAHEVGHAIQHNQQYGPLEMRHKIYPVTNFASTAAFPILLAGIFLNLTDLLLLGIILFSAVVVFHVITLPVELNASRRAVIQLTEAGLVTSQEVPMVKNVLNAAALTYIAATIMAVANLLYYLLIFLGRDE